MAESVEEALELARLARDAGVKHGVVQDKLFLPGLLKLRRLMDSGFFGRVLSVRGEFGYWVFEGDLQEANRPSWNYRAEDGGGIVLDMFCHWRYVLDNVIAPGPQRVRDDRHAHPRAGRTSDGDAYAATADDAAYGVFELEGGIVAQLNSSWCVRVFRDELVEFQVDGTHGSAVAGLRRCRIQPREATPRAIWNPDIPATEDFRGQWLEVPDNEEFDNGFKVQWEAVPAPRRRGRAVPVGPAGGREGRPARAARAARGGRGPAARRAGADAVRLPTADGALREWRPADAPAYGRADGRAARPRAWRSRPRTWSPIRSPRTGRARRRGWTGRRRWPSAGTCGRTGWAWPTRWTPRSAAWGSTGTRPRS